MRAPTIWTIGHSTRTATEFVDVLRAYDIELIADVRRYPGSRRLPHFSSEQLAADLGAAGIFYRHIVELGGRRASLPDSPNDGWRHPAFRGYADYIGTDTFAEGLQELLSVAPGLRTAIMCAEVLWWRCHRRLISDVLVSLGYKVIHIRDRGVAEEHELTAPARMVDGFLSYAADPGQLKLDIAT
jgi:uncharacterized protein (DUF488 family)